MPWLIQNSFNLINLQQFLLVVKLIRPKKALCISLTFSNIYKKCVFFLQIFRICFSYCSEKNMFNTLLYLFYWLYFLCLILILHSNFLRDWLQVWLLPRTKCCLRTLEGLQWSHRSSTRWHHWLEPCIVRRDQTRLWYR